MILVERSRAPDVALLRALDAYRSVLQRLGFSPGVSSRSQSSHSDILFLGSFKPFTGISRYAEALLDGLVKLGYSVHVAGCGVMTTSKHPFTSLDEALRGGTVDEAWQELGTEIDRIVVTITPRIIITNRGFPYSLVAPQCIVSRQQWHPLLGFFPGHHTEMDLLEGAIGKAWASIAHECRMHVGISRYISSQVEEKLGHRDVRCVRAGYDPELFAPNPTWRSPGDIGSARLAYIGRLDFDKHPDIAVDAMAILSERGMRPHLNVFGDGSLGPALERRVTQLGDSVSVSMHGSVSAESVVAGHHVLVVPSSYERLGLQAIEPGSTAEVFACG